MLEDEVVTAARVVLLPTALMDDVRRAITFMEEVAPVVNGACWADGVH